MNIDSPSKQTPSVVALQALQDNYIWLLQCDGHAIVVDPGAAEPVTQYLQQNALSLDAILITHHHYDHIDGSAALVAQSGCTVYSPDDERIKLPNQQHVRDQQTLAFFDGQAQFQVLAIPGHTESHLAWLGRFAPDAPAHLFCGDALFCGGCGRLLGGSAAQMHASLQRLAKLPDETLVYSAHEYTLSNLAFAQAAEPDNPQRDAFLERARALRDCGQPTLPSTIALEKAINPFMRAPDLERFTLLREWKDRF